MKLFIAFLAFSFVFVGIVTSQQPYITAITGGEGHFLALQSDRIVFAWGRNDDGQLGLPGGNNNVPIQIPLLEEVTAIAASAANILTGSFSLAAKSDGTAWGWGNNSGGTLGNGTITSSVIPVQATGLSQIITVAGGTNRSYALKGDGTVWAWGSNILIPILNPIPPGTTAIAAGKAIFFLALQSDGTVWMQSSGGTSQQVQGLTDVIAITAGGSHSLALKSDGTVWGWGNSPSIPTQVPGLMGVTSIAAGGDHSLALLSNGIVKSWGLNNAGQLGNGTFINSLVPIAVNISNVVALAKSFSDSSLVLKADGTLWAWGDNTYGQLGNGVFGGSYSNPVQALLSSSPPPPPPPPNFPCAVGNVNSANGPPADVLLVNGSAGNVSRIVNVGLNESITVTLAAPPMGPNPSFALVWGWAGYPTTPTPFGTLGQSPGCTVNATSSFSSFIPLYAPAIVVNTAGFQTQGVGTLQGMILDFGAGNPSFFSITNAVILNVQ